MITRLQIKGLAIIDSLQIEFAPGFNVITGETGAGKSVLILALHFLTGAKVGSEVVRSGEDFATVSGEFVVPTEHPVVLCLANLGIPVEENGAEVLICVRRQINQKGRSQAWVNDVAVAAPSLKEIGGALVDVFAQHENQRLMNPNEHIRYLDQYAGNENALKEVENLYRECLAEISGIENVLKLIQNSQRDQDYLHFRLEELKRFEPSVSDFLKINEVSESAGQLMKEREVYIRAVAGLEGSEGGSVASALWEVAKVLGHLGERGLSLKSRVESAAHEIDELSFEINQKSSGYEVDEKTVEEAQSRQFGYQDLFRKHSVKEVEALLAAMEKLSIEVKALESGKEIIQTHLNRISVVLALLKPQTHLLSQARHRSATSLQKVVQKEMQELSMAGARLDTEWVPVEKKLPELELASVGGEVESQWHKLKTELFRFSEKGAEKVHFLLSSNPGEPSLPLVKIASGGELSRIMLALKKTLAADAETCVLVFDEIDAGISGRVADVVGKKLRELSQQFQVICISHLPQVAVYADTHCLVRKEGKKNRTETSIIRLTKEESAKEIARLLSGREVTASSLANAQNMISVAHQGRGIEKKAKEINPTVRSKNKQRSKGSEISP